MRFEDTHFDISPKIVRTGRHTRIRVRPRYRGLSGTMRVSLTGVEGLCPPQVIDGIAVDEGGIAFSCAFPAEQEYILALEQVSGGSKPQFLAEVRIVALDQDLFIRRPFKGDMHMHSTRSDGMEEPAYVAGACRRIGMDFMALTDHRLYSPSIEAIRAFEGCPTDLLILPGEEVHPPDCLAHILNIGGSASVNALFPTDEYRAGVDRIAAALPDITAEHRRAYAACAWCFDRIRRLGGIGILPHPYWLTHNAYNVAEPVLSALFERIPFDALEVLGGYASFYREANSLQVARYHEERSRGKPVAAVGSSDAHGCEKGELFGWYYSIVFAPRLDLPAIAEAIRGMSSVAVEWLPGEQPHVYGPFRLVKYAHFLLRDVFPLHDDLASEEGRLMLRWLEGDPAANDMLSALRGRCARLYDRLWDAGA